MMTTKPNLTRRLLAAGLAAPLLATSVLAYAQGTPAPTPPVSAAPAPATGGPRANLPTATNVADLRDMSAITLQGRVAERFGDTFILEDATGRTLVETGPRGERSDLVSVGDEVRVEGRFERGRMHAAALTVGEGERVALERPRPDRDGPRGPGRDRDGPRGPGGPGGPGGERAHRGEERRGGWFSGGVDEAAAEAALGAAGYTQVVLLDAKKHHAEFTARDAAGASWRVKVDEDNAIREREPYAAPLSEDATRTAVEALGYTWEGGFETRRNHVEADARTPDGRSVRVEIAADGSLRKERFDD